VADGRAACAGYSERVVLLRAETPVRRRIQRGSLLTAVCRASEQDPAQPEHPGPIGRIPNARPERRRRLLDPGAELARARRGRGPTVGQAPRQRAVVSEIVLGATGPSLPRR